MFRAGIPDIDVQGDLIQVDDGDGNAATMPRVQIVSMTADSITVDQPVTFGNGAGIALPYDGNAPDIGAFESVP